MRKTQIKERKGAIQNGPIERGRAQEIANQSISTASALGRGRQSKGIRVIIHTSLLRNRRPRRDFAITRQQEIRYGDHVCRIRGRLCGSVNDRSAKLSAVCAALLLVGGNRADVPRSPRGAPLHVAARGRPRELAVPAMGACTVRCAGSSL
jgi:hypothetical protein